MASLDNNGWSKLLEPILTTVLRKLDARDVVACSKVCRYWNEVSENDRLWKHLFKRDYIRRNTYDDELERKDLNIRPGADNWKDEYARIKDQVPCIETQTLRQWFHLHLVD